MRENPAAIVGPAAATRKRGEGSELRASDVGTRRFQRRSVESSKNREIGGEVAGISTRFDRPEKNLRVIFVLQVFFLFSLPFP